MPEPLQPEPEEKPIDPANPPDPKGPPVNCEVPQTSVEDDEEEE